MYKQCGFVIVHCVFSFTPSMRWVYLFSFLCSIDDNLIGEVIVYDPSTDEWSKVRVLPDEYLVSDNAAFTYEGKLYMF